MKVDIDVGPYRILKDKLYYCKVRHSLYYKHRKKKNDRGKYVYRIMQYHKVEELPKEKREKFEQWLKEQST